MPTSARSPRAVRRARASPTCSRACAVTTTRSQFTAPDATDLKACDVVFFATPHGVAMAQARGLVDAGVQDHRPRRRLPHPGRRAVRALVQDFACVPGPARRVRLRTAGVPSRRDPQRAHRRQPRLLSDGDATRASFRCSKQAWSTASTSSPIASPARPGRAARPRSACSWPKRRTTSRPTASSGHRHHPETCRSSQAAAGRR